MKSYKIYAKASCGYCARLLQAMINKKKTFYVEFLDDKQHVLAEVKNKYNHHTVPIVILRENGEETLIGGCDDALKMLNKEN
tara:strand:- start:3285 stop:3530 length:246 start_codon:yes stop_codon:yes gene_type:complete